MMGSAGGGMHGGMMGSAGGGMPGGPAGAMAGDASHAADRALFHYLLDHREKIQRKVTKLPNGVETLTESADPEVSQKLREHVQSMRSRLEQKRPIHMRDPLFAEIFSVADLVSMSVEPTKNGVRVVETSTDPHVVALIQAHAEVVNKFVEKGYEEMRKNHPVPK